MEATINDDDREDRREAAHLAYLATLTPEDPDRFGSPEWDAYVDAAVAHETAVDPPHPTPPSPRPRGGGGFLVANPPIAGDGRPPGNAAGDGEQTGGGGS